MIDGESGAAIAWRLLATLEGVSLLLVTSALFLYTARSRATRKQVHRKINSVLISNTTNSLGKKLQQRLEEQGCTVYTHTGATTSAAVEVDALIIVGADTNNGLDGITQLVTEDVNGNINLLETLSHVVRRGGCIVWACAGATTDSFSDTARAFDAVLRASLQHVAKISHCESIWIGRHAEAELAADKVLATLFSRTSSRHSLGHTLRNVADNISKCLDRCWKMVTLQTS